MKKIRSGSLTLGILVLAASPVVEAHRTLAQTSGGGDVGGSAAPVQSQPVRPQTQQPPPASQGTSRSIAGSATQKDVEECMKLWDAGTHMTKREWRVTCERSLRESPTVLIPELPKAEPVR